MNKLSLTNPWISPRVDVIWIIERSRTDPSSKEEVENLGSTEAMCIDDV